MNSTGNVSKAYHLLSRSASALDSFGRSTVTAIPAPIKINAKVALKLAGAMQLIQVPIKHDVIFLLPIL